MKFGISREVLPPVQRAYRAALPYLLGAAAVTLSAIGIYALANPPVPVSVEINPAAPAPAPVATTEVIAMPLPAVIEIEPAAAPAPPPVPQPRPEPTVSTSSAATGDGFYFLTAVGGSIFMHLGDAKGIERGASKIVGDFKETAIARVDAENVPARYRQWRGREVIVNSSCRARVEDFAVVARVVGDPVYYGRDIDGWDEKSLFEAGAVSFAAKLSDDCTGTYARDAQLPAIIAAVPSKNPEAVADARADFLRSDAVKKAQVEWAEAGGEGDITKNAPIDVQTVVHPTTGAEWIMIHMNGDQGCGGPEINVFALYQVNALDNTVTRSSIERLTDTSRVAKLLDVNGDGRLERIVADWLGNSYRLEDLEGRALKTLDTPFYGCPC